MVTLFSHVSKFEIVKQNVVTSQKKVAKSLTIKGKTKIRDWNKYFMTKEDKRRIKIKRKQRDYHLMFADIKMETLDAIRRAVREKGLFRARRENPERAYEILRELMVELNRIYNLPILPKLRRGSYEVYRQGVNPPIIELPKPSLVSFLHEFRHHMQIAGRRQRYPNREVDARAWSISAFHLALPEEFDNAWRKGLIWYMPPYRREG